jgi:hypothetical protein
MGARQQCVDVFKADVANLIALRQRGDAPKLALLRRQTEADVGALESLAATQLQLRAARDFRATLRLLRPVSTASSASGARASGAAQRAVARASARASPEAKANINANARDSATALLLRDAAWHRLAKFSRQVQQFVPTSGASRFTRGGDAAAAAVAVRCPLRCSGRGTCAPTGCLCDAGFSGRSCMTVRRLLLLLWLLASLLRVSSRSLFYLPSSLHVRYRVHSTAVGTAAAMVVLVRQRATAPMATSARHATLSPTGGTISFVLPLHCE